MNKLWASFGLVKSSKFLLLLTLFVFGLLAFAKTSYASEGTVEIRSVTDLNYRCFATSILTESETYKILFTCRDLIYPPAIDKFAYIAWGSTLEGNGPVRFGELGKGKASFETKKAFWEIFITVERNNNIQKPEGETVMRGNVNPIAFLGSREENSIVPTISPTETKNSTANQSASGVGQKVIPTLGRAALIIFIVIIVIIVIAIAFSRTRKPYSS